MYYAQFDTDRLISEFFGHDFKGVCVDVGSAQPIYGNNTYHFETKGWKVYCIEPNKRLYERLTLIRENVFNFACGSKDEDNVDFTICTLQDGNQEAISSLELDNRLVENHLAYNPRFETTKVKLRTLNSFFEEQGIEKIDFISIDTEGTEIDVLVGLDLKKYNPSLLVIENNFENYLIDNYLLNFGYKKFHRSGVNDFYSFHSELVSEVPCLRYTCSGHFGDLIHELYVIKKNYERTKLKGVLNLVVKTGDHDGSFLRPIDEVVNELCNPLKKQEYILDVNNSTDINIDLGLWRYSEYRYKTCWTNYLTSVYSLIKPKRNDPWLKIEKKDSSFEGKILIHQSNKWYRKIDNFPWEEILKNNKCTFISFSVEEYENFKYKDLVDLYIVKDFDECCSILNSCKFYIGNLTSITAIAQAIGTPKLLEMFMYYRDCIHYIGEKEYSDNFFYISELDDVKNLDGLEKFIDWRVA
jgi:FkbM family methyltransferase